MTKEDFRLALEMVELSHEGCARWLDITSRQVRRWLSGESPVPESVAKLLRLAIKLGLNPKEIA